MSNNQLKYVLFGRTRKAKVTRIFAVSLSVCAFGAIGSAPVGLDPSDMPVRIVTDTLDLPTLDEQIKKLSLESSNEEPFVHTVISGRGDSISSLFIKLGIQDADALAFVKRDRTAKKLLSVASNKELVAETTTNGDLISLRAPLGDGDSRFLTLTREGDKFKAKIDIESLERRVEMRSATVGSSLFVSADAVELPDTITNKMIDMFSTRVDFSDLRKTDQFNVVYESFWDNGVLVKTGRILAAQFINEGQSHQTLWFDDPYNKASSGYYSFDGTPLKKAFLKSPLEFSRVSSGFAMRVHPVLGDWRQHKGVDFAAPSGTPIRSAGDGVVDFAGTQNGYGNVVMIKHMSQYSTVYAHMSRFASDLRKGSKVSQGEVIGFVGATGWATGPHLHYEFRINNQPQNPLAINAMNAQPLAGPSLKQFKSVAADMQHRFAVLMPLPYEHKVAAR